VTGAPERSLDWLRDGTDRLLTLVAGLSDDEFAAPSLLPSWSRGTLIAHLALNAGALGNLVAWARTGVESPMYASTEQRAADIARLAAAPAAQIRAEFLAGATRLDADLGTLPEACWAAPVRTARGRPIPASEIPWMRNREVWVHAVDLNAGVGFDGFPPEVLAALLDDAAALMSGRPEAVPVAARTPDGARTWAFGSDPTTTVTGDLPDLCAWALGRAGAPKARVDKGWPTLPEWL
jgi:maleylpyruvate isomerase